MTLAFSAWAAATFWFSPAHARALQDGPPKIDSAGIEAASGFLERLRESRGITGLSAAVAIDGELLWSAGFGFEDAESGIAATSETVYRVGSVSKVLTTAAIAKLLEHGRLDLDTDIRAYVPAYPAKSGVLTARLLAGHLGGVRHYRLGETAAPKKAYADVVDALELFRDDPLLHAPGERWSYSSYAWTLLSAAVQGASDRPFPEYVRSAVLSPLGMSDTRAEVADSVGAASPHLAALYDEGVRVARNDISYIWAAGGYLSTVGDLVRLGSAFLPGSGFIADETLDVLATNQTTVGGEEVDHGIGWIVDADPDVGRVIYHGGTIIGGHSVLYVELERRIVVAILANESTGFGLIDAYIVASQVIGRTDPPRFVRDARSVKIRRESRERLFDALERWQDALRGGDIDAALAVVSEDFTSARWRDKAALAETLARWFASGPVEVGGDLGIGVRGIEPGASSDISGFVLGVDGVTERLMLLFTKQGGGEWLLTDVR
ncbi:MAG: serine hydrolase domain-containing protein [Gemmatimonadota bacterium]